MIIDVTLLMPKNYMIRCDFVPIVELALVRAGFSNSCDVTIKIINDTDIQALNKQHRGMDSPTNVLSFPAYDPALPHPPDAPIELGDIVLAHETIAREAEAQGKTFEHHLTHLIIHGTLHLIGHDHEDETEAEVMEALEVRILAELGIKNPYED